MSWRSNRVSIPIPERNRQILQMRKEGMRRVDVAKKFELSPSRIWLIERRDRADRSMAERRAKLRQEIQAADDLEKMWPVEDLVDALDLIIVTRIRLLQHFVKTGKAQISLRELMDMCLNAPVEGSDFMWPPLYRVLGVGKKGFWSVVTGMDLGRGREHDRAYRESVRRYCRPRGFLRTFQGRRQRCRNWSVGRRNRDGGPQGVVGFRRVHNGPPTGRLTAGRR
jgi:hypothetical protein